MAESAEHFEGKGANLPNALPRRREKPARTPLSYQFLDNFSGLLILLAVVIAPWLFGTTEDWAVHIVNAICFSTGALLLAKVCYRVFASYSPPRWGEEKDPGRWLTIVLGALTVLILAYCLTAALNARATFHLREQRFEYHEYKNWLPFSYDSNRSWYVFWNYLALAFFFWGVRDWLRGKTRHERHRTRKSDDDFSEPEKPRESVTSVPVLPARLRLLLWVLCVNGALVAVQGTLQRLGNSYEMLWLRESYWRDPLSCFGPYSYRSNAAQYLNLIWPVCLGFWWTLHEARRSPGGKMLRVGEGPHLLLLPITIMTAAAPVISTSRGGALIAGLSLIVCTFVIFTSRRTRASTRISLLVLLAVILGSAWYLGWTQLEFRFKTLEKDQWSNRGEIYDNSKQMAEDFPWFGTGPGTFRSVYQLYRTDPKQWWHAFLHDDWLETRVTFGMIGMGLVLLALFVALARWFLPGAIPIPGVLAASFWIALGGCLIHAKFDFPLQVYSILMVFLLHCSILSSTCKISRGK